MTHTKSWLQLFFRLGGGSPAILAAVGLGFTVSQAGRVYDQPMAFWIGCVWTTIALLASIGPFRRSLEALRIRENGEVRQADIVEVRVTGGASALDYMAQGIRAADNEAWLIWRDPSGTTGQSLAGRASDFFGLQSGDKITIYVDPSRPDLAFWDHDVGRRSAIPA